MKILVVYDTAYGNTEEIGKAIGRGIGSDARVLRAGDVTPADLEGLELLVVGSPTQAGRPLPETQKFLNEVAAQAVKGMKVATFDTRASSKWVTIFGFAAGRIARTLKRAGAELVASPEPFYVAGTKGPLKEGEPERATEWGKKIAG
jgi:flavodoxin